LDVTWGAGGATSDLTVDICSKIQKEFGEANMHLTCTNMPVEKITKGLEEAKKAGIRNIVALRGDPPKGQDKWEAVEGGYSNAVDVVKYIRKTHGDYFGISVAGYPEGHTEAKSLEQDIAHLKEKVDAGADFIITQLFYDVDNFIEWVDKCRQAGINVPIIPGIMPIQSYAGWKRMTDFCKTKIPQAIQNRLDSIKSDEKAVQQYGVELGIEMCKKIILSGVSPGLHFYTLNKEKITRSILEGLGLVTPPLLAAPASAPASAPADSPKPAKEIQPEGKKHVRENGDAQRSAPAEERVDSEGSGSKRRLSVDGPWSGVLTATVTALGAAAVAVAAVVVVKLLKKT
jgi:methylenetetrahydrofolate reductase (NADPH)